MLHQLTKLMFSIVGSQDGTISTLTGSCTVVRDFLDFTYHSIFDYLDEFRIADPHFGKPVDIK